MRPRRCPVGPLKSAGGAPADAEPGAGVDSPSDGRDRLLIRDGEKGWAVQWVLLPKLVLQSLEPDLQSPVRILRYTVARSGEPSSQAHRPALGSLPPFALIGSKVSG